MDERKIVIAAIADMLKDALLCDDASWLTRTTEALGLTDKDLTNDVLRSFIPGIAVVHGITKTSDEVGSALIHAFHEGAKMRAAIDNAKKETATP